MKPGRVVLDDRFWSKVEKTDSCWVWKARRIRGYGQFHFEGKTVLAHRLVAQSCVGIIPDGLEVCHGCDNRACVKPDHMFIGTRSDNMQDCVAKNRSNLQLDPPNKKKTHCPKGHVYSGANLKIEKAGWRKCRVCSNEARMRSYYAKTK